MLAVRAAVSIESSDSKDYKDSKGVIIMYIKEKREIYVPVLDDVRSKR